MNEDYAALADLVGQLLAARWIEEHGQDQNHDGPGTKRPPDLATRPKTGHDGEQAD